MTGLEHYKEAERLIRLAADGFVNPEGGYQDDGPPSKEEIATRLTIQDQAREDGHFFLAEAQVHATLALAAATALSNSGRETASWRDVAGEPPSQPSAVYA